MEVQVSYQNRRRSDRADLFLAESMHRLEPINPQITRAKADVSADPNGDNIVRLHIVAPKPYETVVSAKHNNLYSAIRMAVTKLRRVLVKAKEKSVRGRKGATAVRDAVRQTPPPPEPIDADNILKFETARLRSQSRGAPPMYQEETAAQALTIPDASQWDIEKVPGIGRTRALALRKHLGLRTVSDLEKAAWNAELQRLPGFGKKLEAQILKNVMDLKFSYHPTP